ncbi:nuclear transport factor 2 family protein [Pseudolysobacter antarcticus]|uniref:Nuclear transport factor 2 family protein n=2 Tax=Pseudolysobacter antarcticus TaxID=2511995 RepID=A0A411HQ72_9GAMM|nr:nuclear transport factor 2 family protein [Pseudolysobacter antarcticus]
MFGCLSFLLIALSLSAATPAVADEEKTLRALEQKLCEAFRSSNAEVIGQIEDDNYTLTSSTAKVTGRADDLAEAKNNEPHYDVFSNHDVKLRFYGDTAILNGITSVKGTSAGKPFAADFQYTDTWIKRDGQWKLVASHATKIVQ